MKLVAETGELSDLLDIVKLWGQENWELGRKETTLRAFGQRKMKEKTCSNHVERLDLKGFLGWGLFYRIVALTASCRPRQVMSCCHSHGDPNSSVDAVGEMHLQLILHCGAVGVTQSDGRGFTWDITPLAVPCTPVSWASVPNHISVSILSLTPRSILVLYF